MKTYEEKYRMEYLISGIIMLVMGLVGLYFSYKSSLYNILICIFASSVGAVTILKVLVGKLEIPKKPSKKEDEVNSTRILKLCAIIITISTVALYYNKNFLTKYIGIMAGMTIAAIYFFYVKNYRNK